MFDVVALGELLIDFVQVSLSPDGNPVFQANPGGAPCNVLAMLNNLGLKTAFIGKVGNDIFGHRLKNTLDKIKINTDNLIIDKDTKTTLAFVETDALGDRNFSFFRNPGADMMLNKTDVNFEALKSCKAFHFGTLSMTHSKPEKATKLAIKVAQENDAIISFDPNLRPPLWKSLDDAREKIDYGCRVSDIVKIEESELCFLTNCNDKDKAIEKFRNEYKNIKLLTVTFGRNGSKAFLGETEVEKPTFLNVKTIDTTGAGDTFCACCLAWYLKNKDNKNITYDMLEEMLVFANAAASIVTTRKGALLSMPDKKDVEQLLSDTLTEDKL